MKVTINEHPDISQARKDLTISGEPYNRDNPEHVSQWAAAITLARYKIGEEVDEEEFCEYLSGAKTQQLLDSMVEEGTIVMTWNNDQPAYGLTEKGKKMAEEL